MSHRQPYFSIIIPTYDRPGQLADCLHSLVGLNYPHNCFEVIVVNDGGDTTLEAIVDQFRNQINLSLITQPNAGPAAARNSGAVKAKGEFLAFTDDDCIPSPDWLQVLASHFAEMPDYIIGGRTINLLAKNIYSTMSQLIIDVVYRHYNAKPNQSRFFTSNNMALPIDHFFAIGGFNPNFTTSEDREFCDRSIHDGFQMIYVSEALVYHAHLLTFPTFVKQHFNYGRGAFYFHRARAQRGQERIKVEPLPFYLNLLRYPFSQARGLQTLLLAVLLGVSPMANAIGFLWERRLQTKASRSRIL